MNIGFFILAFLFLFGGCSLSLLKSSINRIGKIQGKEILSSYFFFFSFLNYFFPRKKWESFFFTNSISSQIFFILYAICGLFSFPFFDNSFYFMHKGISLSFVILAIFCITLFGVMVDFFFRLFSLSHPTLSLKLFSPFASFYLILLFPLSGLLMKLTLLIKKEIKRDILPKKYFQIKEKLLEILNESGITKLLDAQDQKLISSFITFREKVAREIMIPRINIICLSSNTTIRDASKLFIEEDYSRIPVYKDHLDNIIGILMYKDVLKIFAHSEENQTLLNQSIEKIIKSVIYSPENKKISHLFQEFRSKKMHIAIVVNEYGGTEGIITIEDILEELVGEIEDEYDIEKEKQFWRLPNGHWVVDAKMSIIDIEEKIGIKIPHNPQYETLGGYIFHLAGTIPAKGWKLHHDDFEIEVLISNERCIEKVRIVPEKK